MAIKEVVYHYRKYLVTSAVDYIPCLPVMSNSKVPATRIPKGCELTFIRKIDEVLYEVEFENTASRAGKQQAMITSMAFDWLLPVFRRN